MKNSHQQLASKDVTHGNICVMKHSFFSDVIRIACTPEDPKEYAKSLSASTPGDYTLIYAQLCNDPCKIKNRIKEHLSAQMYTKEFYQVPVDVAKRLVKREILRIPALSTL